MKIERNIPCLCGSGKKYKKCCLTSDQLSKAVALSDVDEACEAALAKVEAGDIDEAGRDSTALFHSYPDHPKVCFLQGVLSIECELYETAMIFFERAVELDPSFIEAYFNLANVYQQQLMLPESIACFKEVVGRVGKDDPLGKAAQQALDGLKKIIESSGQTLDEYLKGQALFDEAFDLLMQQDYEEAIALFQEVLKLDPRHVQSYGNLGIAYSGLGQQKKALECLDQALSIDPNYEPALNNRQIFAKFQEGEQNRLPMGEIDYYKQKLESEGGKRLKQQILDI